MTPVLVTEPADLDPGAIRAVADGASVSLAPSLLERLEESRALTLTALADAGPVYGVTTGMGLQSNLAVGATDQPDYQGDLMLARSVGSAPWLDRRTARAVLATRLRTLLDPETGASPALARFLVTVLDADLHPAVPATGNGAAGEIIPLAHLGGFLTGSGDALDAGGAPVPAADALARAGVPPYRFGPKEGVAFLQGVPVASARAVLLAEDARLAGCPGADGRRRGGRPGAGAARPVRRRAGPGRRPARGRARHPARARGRGEVTADAPGAGVVPGDRSGGSHLLRVVGHLDEAVGGR